MKTLYAYFFGSLFLLLTATCNNKQDQKESTTTTTETELSKNTMEIIGTIQEQGMTTYQYGTHTITTANDDFYALKSDSVDLGTYVGKEVTITAEKIEGYPVDGGPVYLKVLEVKED